MQCTIWGSVFKTFIYVETVNECHHKMKRDYSQMIFGFSLKDVEVAFKLKRYIFKLHLFGFQFVMHLSFCIFCNWRSCVLFEFELWYHALLHFLYVEFVMCVVSRTMKQKLLESVTRSIAKSKPALLQYLFSSRNVSNVKPLWLVCV